MSGQRHGTSDAGRTDIGSPPDSPQQEPGGSWEAPSGGVGEAAGAAEGAEAAGTTAGASGGGGRELPSGSTAGLPMEVEGVPVYQGGKGHPGSRCGRGVVGNGVGLLS